jgi:hypothetical protein
MGAIFKYNGIIISDISSVAADMLNALYQIPSRGGGGVERRAEYFSPKKGINTRYELQQGK